MYDTKALVLKGNEMPLFPLLSRLLKAPSGGTFLLVGDFCICMGVIGKLRPSFY